MRSPNHTMVLKNQCFYTVIALFFLAMGGCCIEKDKPGVVVRGDWSLELNRSKTIEHVSEWVPSDSDDASCGIRKKKKGHHSPCGRWGCLKCALGPSTGEEELENENENAETDENRPLANYLRQYPYLPHPGAPFPGMSPIYAGAPGMPGPMGAPMGGFAPPPIPVVNPRTGQQTVMQPALPGQPGVLMLHAQSGQPIMVNPLPAAPLPVAPNFPQPGMPPYAPNVNPALAMQQQAAMQQHIAMQQQAGMLQAGMISPGQPPYGMMPPYGNPTIAPPNAPWGMAAVDPSTCQIMPNPYGPYGNPNAGEAQAENQTDEKTASKDAPRSQMPTPRFHSVPTQPVFQRSEGLAKSKEAEEEQRLRQ